MFSPFAQGFGVCPVYLRMRGAGVRALYLWIVETGVRGRFASFTPFFYKVCVKGLRKAATMFLAVSGEGYGS
jgi:hypothetical protein